MKVFATSDYPATFRKARHFSYHKRLTYLIATNSSEKSKKALHLFWANRQKRKYPISVRTPHKGADKPRGANHSV